MRVTPVDLDALEALLAKATPGEWAVAEPWAGYCSINADCTPILYTTSAGCENAEANHDSIAALHNAAPALIAELRELRAYRAEVECSAPIVQGLLDSGEAAEGKVAQLEERIRELEGRNLKLAAEVGRLKAASRWRPIDSSPKDGTPVDLFNYNGRVPDCKFLLGAWKQYSIGSFDKMAWVDLDWPPTHWLPLIAWPEGANCRSVSFALNS